MKKSIIFVLFGLMLFSCNSSITKHVETVNSTSVDTITVDSTMIDTISIN